MEIRAMIAVLAMYCKVMARYVEFCHKFRYIFGLLFCVGKWLYLPRYFPKKRHTFV